MSVLDHQGCEFSLSFTWNQIYFKLSNYIGNYSILVLLLSSKYMVIKVLPISGADELSSLFSRYLCKKSTAYWEATSALLHVGRASRPEMDVNTCCTYVHVWMCHIFAYFLLISMKCQKATLWYIKRYDSEIILSIKMRKPRLL